MGYANIDQPMQGPLDPKIRVENDKSAEEDASSSFFFFFMKVQLVFKKHIFDCSRVVIRVEYVRNGMGFSEKSRKYDLSL